MKLVAMTGIAGLTLAVAAAFPAMAAPYAFTQLPLLSAGGLNDAGQVAGLAPVPGHPGEAGLALYDHGAVTLLGYGPTASYYQSVSVTGLNDSGLIIGVSYPPHFTFPFAYQDGLPFNLAGVQGNSPSASLSGVNNKGEIVGCSGLYCGPTYAFLLSNGVVTRLPVPGPSPTGGVTVSLYANGINDLEQIVGFYTQNDGGALNPNYTSTGFLLSGGVYSPIAVPGAAQTFPTAINDNGEVVGTFNDSTGTHAFEEENGVFSTIVGPGGGNFLPSGLNSSGQIIGFQVTSDYPNDYHRTDYLGTPQAVPEPSSLALLCAGLTGLFGWGARGRRGSIRR